MDAKKPQMVNCTKSLNVKHLSQKMKKKKMCEKYWTLNDYCHQKDFILCCIEIKQASKLCNRVLKTLKPQSNSNNYNFYKTLRE